MLAFALDVVLVCPTKPELSCAVKPPPLIAKFHEPAVAFTVIVTLSPTVTVVALAFIVTLAASTCAFHVIDIRTKIHIKKIDTTFWFTFLILHTSLIY